MKKILLTVVFTVGIFFGVVAVSQAANHTIPQLAVAPTIDGVMDTYEWYGAYTQELSYEDGMNEYTSSSMVPDGCQSYQVYQAWYYDGSNSRSGYYFCVVAQDSTRGRGFPDGSALNETDSVMIYFDPLNTKEDGNSQTFSFSFCPWTETDLSGPASYFEHRQYNGKLTNGASVQVASDVREDGWTMEIFVSFRALTISNTAAANTQYSTIGMGMDFRDYDATRPEGNQELYNCTDFGREGGDYGLITAYCSYWNVVTLGETVYPPNYNTSTADLTEFIARLRIADDIIMNGSEYTQESLSAFTDVVNEVSDFSARIPQSVADEYTAMLDEAFTKLVKKYYTELTSLAETCASLVSSDYTAETWSALSSSYDAARQIDGSEPKDEIRSAYESLLGAYENLVRADNGEHIIDSTALQAELDAYAQLDSADYTSQSWEAYSASVQAAQALNAVDNTQSDYDLALQNLLSAKDGLRQADDFAILDEDVGIESGIDVVLLVYIIVMAVVVVVIAAVIVVKVMKKKKTASDAPQDTPKIRKSRPKAKNRDKVENKSENK